VETSPIFAVDNSYRVVPDRGRRFWILREELRDRKVSPSAGKDLGEIRAIVENYIPFEKGL